MSSNGGPKSNLIEIGALWYSTKTPGVMTGKLGNARLVLLPNDRKEGAQPDCRIFVAPFKSRTSSSLARSGLSSRTTCRGESHHEPGTGILEEESQFETRCDYT